MPLNPSEQAFFRSLAIHDNDHQTQELDKLSIEELRQNANAFSDCAGPAADIYFEDLTIPCQAGHTLKARFYSADAQIKPLLIFFPGCGYILDLFESNHVAVSKMAKTAGCHALLVQFRLVPEHPFPAAFNDGVEAVQYVINNPKQFNADPNRIIVGGLSSGAGIAATVCHALKNSAQFKIYHQLLCDGFYDFSDSLDAYREYEKHDFLCHREATLHLIKTCVPQESMRRDPLWSPYWATDFSNLPSATVIIPEYSGVRSHSEAYAQKLVAAGVPVNKTALPEQTHNTIICRSVMSDGEDPAIVAGQAIKALLINNKP